MLLAPSCRGLSTSDYFSGAALGDTASPSRKPEPCSPELPLRGELHTASWCQPPQSTEPSSSSPRAGLSQGSGPRFTSPRLCPWTLASLNLILLICKVGTLILPHWGCRRSKRIHCTQSRCSSYVNFLVPADLKVGLGMGEILYLWEKEEDVSERA